MRHHPGKYEDLIDEWMHAAAIEQDEGFGDVASPVGYVWKLDIDEDAQDGESALLERKIAEWSGKVWWLVVENDQGIVYFQGYGSEDSRNETADKLEEAFNEWDNPDDSPGELADHLDDSVEVDALISAAAALNDSVVSNPEYLRAQVELICDMLPGGTSEWREDIEAAIKERIQ